MEIENLCKLVHHVHKRLRHQTSSQARQTPVVINETQGEQVEQSIGGGGGTCSLALLKAMKASDGHSFSIHEFCSNPVAAGLQQQSHIMQMLSLE